MDPLSEFSIILYARVHHLLDQSEKSAFGPMECNQFFHTSPSVCSNKFVYKINHSVVVMEMECTFCVVEQIILIGPIAYMDLVFRRLQTSLFQKKS